MYTVLDHTDAIVTVFVCPCSVSDLLDYINPNKENRGRDSESGKRRYSSIKVSC